MLETYPDETLADRFFGYSSIVLYRGSIGQNQRAVRVYFGRRGPEEGIVGEVELYQLSPDEQRSEPTADEWAVHL